MLRECFAKTFAERGRLGNKNLDEVEDRRRAMRFLGHKELSSTMVYARAHDQTIAEDYFAAMQRVEQRLEIVTAGQKDMEVVKVQEPVKLIHLIEQLELPELCFAERLDITLQLRELFGDVQEFEPAMVFA